MIITFTLRVGEGPRTCDDFGLGEDHLLRDAALPLVQLLADAGDDAETGLQSVGGLLANELTTHIKICSQSARRRNGALFGSLDGRNSSCTARRFIAANVAGAKGKIKSSRITSSLSPKTWRLSECPRITQFTPQSLIIAGLKTELHRIEGIN